MTFMAYLDVERQAVAESQQLCAVELTAFCELVDLYERLLRMIPGDRENLVLPAELFLATLNQMYGAGAQMLRRRLPDVHALTRRAIELAATAYRLWKHPELTNLPFAHFGSSFSRIESLVLRNKELPMVFLSHCGQLPV